MSIVVEVIAEYLLANRRLVVPAFGAFMVKESGERVFSELLRTDDGVLALLLSNKGLSEMEVAVTIDRFIFEVRHELEQYGYCRLGDVGTLRIEPETSAIRLYPPVYGEEQPKRTPYIPEPITEDTVEETAQETAQEAKTEEITEHKEPKVPQPKANPKKKGRKRVDWVLILAVVVLVAALLVAAYGFYVSMNNNIDTTADDEAMSSLRVLSKEEIEKDQE